MNANMQLLERIVVALDDPDESWKQDHDDAARCTSIEFRIRVSAPLFRVVAEIASQAVDAAHASRIDDPERSEILVLAKDAILLLDQWCKSDQRVVEAIADLQGKGFEVEGAAQFTACFRDAERKVKEWREEQSKAMELRGEWMRANGLSQEEIAEYCDPQAYPGDVGEEEANLRACAAMKTMPSAHELFLKQVREPKVSHPRKLDDQADLLGEQMKGLDAAVADAVNALGTPRYRAEKGAGGRRDRNVSPSSRGAGNGVFPECVPERSWGTRRNCPIRC